MNESLRACVSPPHPRLWLLAAVLTACTSDERPACEADGSPCSIADLGGRVGDGPVPSETEDASVDLPACEDRGRATGLARLVGEDPEGWNGTVTATTTALQVAPGRWVFALGRLSLEIDSTSDLLEQMSGPLQATIRRDAAALIVRGWAVALRPVGAAGPSLVAWFSWKDSTMRSVLGGFSAPPGIRYEGQGCVIPDACGDRELLAISVDLGGEPVRVPSGSAMSVGVAELINGPSSLPSPESRCTDQSPIYAGTLLLP